MQILSSTQMMRSHPGTADSVFASCRLLSTSCLVMVLASLFSEDGHGKCNFDKKLPTSPVTGEPIKPWYRAGQTWTTVFKDITAVVEECRACLVAAYLIDNAGLAELFGYSKTIEVNADECMMARPLIPSPQLNGVQQCCTTLTCS